MKKEILLLLSLACALPVFSQSKISGPSQLFLKQYQESRQNNRALKSPILKESAKQTCVNSIITLNEGCEAPIEKLEELGVSIDAQVGIVLTVAIPVDAFEQVAELPEVKSVSIAKRLKLRNDKAREYSKVDEVISGTDLPQGYTGKGVIIGIVDSGIDYSHINFRDSLGNNRIVRIYEPQKIGTVTLSDGTTLRGKEYKTEDAINNATRDTKEGSHGTHTSGIAGGSYSKNGLQGMAPEADLVLCGVGDDIYTNYVINSIKYIFDYAKSVNKPAVVNLSLGWHQGPHDGTSSDCVAFDELSDEGHIIVMSAGNEGDTKMYFNKRFTNATDTLKTVLSCNKTYENSGYTYSIYGYRGAFDAWSRDNTRFGVQFQVINKTTKKVLAESEVFFPADDDTKYFTWSSTTDTDLARYFTGKITANAQLEESNNKYNIYSEFYGIKPKSSSNLLAVKFFAQEGTEIDCWDIEGYTDFVSNNMTGYTNGDASYSISDMATGYETISVGAYCTRKYFSTLDGGGPYTYGGTLGNIASFSSYGVDVNGNSHPDVVGPGQSLVSSVNSYDYGSSDDSQACAKYESEDGEKTYYWGPMPGTSMSSPAVAGIIALWLQADSTLTGERVKEILRETSTTDSYTSKGVAAKWGHGKVNALAGIQKVLHDKQSAISSVNTDNNVVMLYPNPSDGKFSVFVPNEESDVKVNIYNLNGALAYSNTLATNNARIDVDVTGTLLQGIYIVNIVGSKANYTSRLVIK